MKNIYFDSEFTCLRNGTTPISIGLVTKDNHFFYAECTDYDESQCDDYINNEILSQTLFLCIEEDKRKEVLVSLQENLDVDSVIMYGTKEEVGIVLTNWLQAFNEDIQFISDVEQYDTVILIDILTNSGTSLDLPKFICPDCININTFIAMANRTSIKEAFNVTREDFVDLDTAKDILGVDKPMKHNSLWDAIIIKLICERFEDYPGGYLLW